MNATQRKRKQRERDASQGIVEIRVRLTAGEAEIYRQAAEIQRGPEDSFAARCLTIGAAFVANAGNVKKVRLHEEP